MDVVVVLLVFLRIPLVPDLVGSFLGLLEGATPSLLRRYCREGHQLP